MCFKGSRNYLHGTDLYNALCLHVPQASGLATDAPLRIVIHHLVSHECDMLLGGPGETVEKPDKVWAEFSFTSSKGSISGWMSETERPVLCRYEYAEELIEKNSTVNATGNQIVIVQDTGFSPIEVAVAMTKKLHCSLLPVQGKWLFTKLELKRLLNPTDASTLRIKLEHNFNNRLTKSSLTAGDTHIGYIFFSLSS